MSRNTKGLDQILRTTPQQITDYYRSSLLQAKICWIAFLIAASIGLSIIVVGVMGMFLKYIESNQVTLAASVLVEVVAVLFHRQYVDATKRMSQCRRDLLAVEFLIFAFEVSRQIESAELKDDTRVIMVTNILSWLINVPPTQLFESSQMFEKRELYPNISRNPGSPLDPSNK